jgi:hypothetical protein
MLDSAARTHRHRTGRLTQAGSFHPSPTTSRPASSSRSHRHASPIVTFPPALPMPDDAFKRSNPDAGHGPEPGVRLAMSRIMSVASGLER